MFQARAKGRCRVVKAFHVFVYVVAVISCFNIVAWRCHLDLRKWHALIWGGKSPHGIERRYQGMMHEYVSNRDLYAETLVKPTRSSIPTNREKRKMYHRPSVYRR